MKRSLKSCKKTKNNKILLSILLLYDLTFN
jgi:hypothetical protein